MTLSPYQYQIDDIVFGRGTQIPIQKVDIQTYNVNNQDFQVQRSDENRFGIDTLVPAPLVFTMSVLNNFQLDSMVGYSSDPFPTNLFASDNQYLNKLAASWKDIVLRLTWGATKPILFCDKSGKVVRVYGRPGKFTHTPRNKEGELWIDVQAEFRRADTFAHSDIEWYVGHPTNPALGMPPNSAPVNAARQDGDGDSWLRILIYGPATNPVITYGDNVIETNSVIPAGVVAEISSYPWMRRYIDSNGLNRRTQIIGDTLYLDQIKFYADTDVDVSWTASGTTSASQIYFLWREAYNVI
jgi:hypothetical protein